MEHGGGFAKLETFRTSHLPLFTKILRTNVLNVGKWLQQSATYENMLTDTVVTVHLRVRYVGKNFQVKTRMRNSMSGSWFMRAACSIAWCCHARYLSVHRRDGSPACWVQEHTHGRGVQQPRKTRRKSWLVCMMPGESMYRYTATWARRKPVALCSSPFLY